MTKVKGLVLQENLVAQEFNLSELLNVEVDESLAAAIGQDIADYIRERSGDNLGIGGKALRKPYSKPYQNSAEFIEAGKSANDVNMKLTGEMLEAIEVLDFDGELLTVGIEGENAPKAHGHMTGKNGQVPKMKREFFGLTQKELKPILDKYKDELPEPKGRATLDAATEAEINKLFRTVGEIFTLEK